MRNRESDAFVHAFIADCCLRIAPFSKPIEFVKESLPQHQNAAIALTEVLFTAISDLSLPDPRDEILIHDMPRKPSSRNGVFDRSVPGRNRTLLVGLESFRHSFE